jgi:hypothetical protein
MARILATLQLSMTRDLRPLAVSSVRCSSSVMINPQRAGKRSIAAGTAKFGSNSIELQCGASASTSSRLAAATSAYVT